MKTKVVSVQLSKACHQDWSLMEHDEGGRFCDFCQKCVVDFSTSSNADIVKILLASEGEVCGRLTKTQLSQLNYYLIAVPSNKNWLKYIGVLSIGAILIAAEAKAIQQNEVVASSVFPSKSSYEQVPIGLKKIYGYVLDEEHHAVVNVQVMITNTKMVATTDKNGRYEFVLTKEIDPNVIS